MQKDRDSMLSFVFGAAIIVAVFAVIISAHVLFDLNQWVTAALAGVFGTIAIIALVKGWIRL